MKLTPEAAAAWRRIFALIKELAQPSPSDLLYQEMCRQLGNGLFEAVDRLAARDWITEHLRPARRPYPFGVGSLKHTYEADRGKHPRYIRASDFARLLKEAGYRFTADGRVYAKEVRR